MRCARRAREDSSSTRRRSSASISSRICLSDSAMNRILTRQAPDYAAVVGRPDGRELPVVDRQVAHRKYTFDLADLLDGLVRHLAVHVDQRVGHLTLRLVHHVVDVEAGLGHGGGY